MLRRCATRKRARSTCPNHSGGLRIIQRCTVRNRRARSLCASGSRLWKAVRESGGFSTVAFSLKFCRSAALRGFGRGAGILTRQEKPSSVLLARIRVLLGILWFMLLTVGVMYQYNNLPEKAKIYRCFVLMEEGGSWFATCGILE